ncbi:MAG TPA: 3-phosphoglycerate dehydrogenase family protein [Candidatus Saccharimonadales bacterium]|nr:3-phosphoglycerate dehydrogenase family protein [Candidatus Saccharimonadales bacterium]
MAAKFSIRTYNKISPLGLKEFDGGVYSVAENQEDPDAIILRSYNLHEEPIPESVVAIGRAGAGVNNIPLEAMSERGIVVFNAPGANANAVREVVVAGMLIAARNIDGAIEYTKGLSGDDIKTQVEAGKKKYAGAELRGKTLSVIGLGAIGLRVANTAIHLGMKVKGFDPSLSVHNALQLNSEVQQVTGLDEALAGSDFITLHIPLLEVTKGLIDRSKLALLKPTAVLLNFSRDEIADEEAVVRALEEGKLGKYVTDFPNQTTIGKKNVIALPHLGASTGEAEENCAVMIAHQLKDYLENGNIRNSVNLPNAGISQKTDTRLCLIHKNKPGIVADVSKVLAKHDLNIAKMLNKSRDNLAYTIIDLDKEIDEKAEKSLAKLKDLISLRIVRR